MSGREREKERERDLSLEINNMTSDNPLKVAKSEMTVCLAADVEISN